MRTRSISRFVTGRKGSGSYLSEELIFRILSWTCVTSLLRCKSVCKLWSSLISNPKFMEAQHTNSNIKIPSILMITSIASQQNPIDNSHAATIVYSNSPEDSVSIPLMAPFDLMDFVGSCNGILCVSNIDASDICLLNPLTRMSKKLPRHVTIDSYAHGERPCKYDVVFGFDCISHDFKVLRFAYRRDNYQLVSVLEAYLYSSNADSWREVELGIALPSMLCYPRHPILRSGPVLDGVLYLEGSVSVVIKSVPGDGSLDDKEEISLWTMEPVSGDFIWNKIFTFDSGCDLDWVFFYLGANQFVGTTKLGTMLYESCKKLTKYIGLPPQSFLVRVLKHTESLLSVKGFERVEES